MLLLAISAAFVGFVHSLVPGHWLPILITVKSQRWPIRKALLGALISASGHVILSVVLAIAVILADARLLSGYENRIESYGGLALLCFGLIYASFAYLRHATCGHAHNHHPEEADGGRKKQKKMGPYLFLFSLGFSPCVVVWPLFAEAALKGNAAVFSCAVGFSLGVICSLTGATLLASLGIMRLDHPILEHYGEMIAGLGVALMGLILFFYP